ncbi:MAG: hypothetical protein Q7W13_13045 [Bacteroidia bacterium]|nr:hypothetical protein [Bacteroidia bacterium]
MATKTVNFTVNAATEAKCTEALTALQTLVTKLPHDDLVYLADLASKKPNFVPQAKPYIKYLK